MKKERANIPRAFPNIIKGISFSLLIAIALSLILTGVFYKLNDPCAYIGIAALVTLYISFFTGGLITYYSTSSVLHTLLYEISYLLVLAVLAIIMPSKIQALSAPMIIAYIGAPITIFIITFFLSRRKHRPIHSKRYRH